MTDWPYILRTHGPLAVRTAFRILGHAADAEDAAQQAFLDALALHRKGAVKSWPALLRHLAACRALDLLRKRTVSANFAPQAPPATARPEAVAIAREHMELLRQGLTELPSREAQIFALRYFGDLTNPEIAAALEIPPGAVAVALHKARTHLQSLLNQDP